MKKILSFLFFISLAIILSACKNDKIVNTKTTLANPWVDCVKDFNCAKRVAKFSFDIKIDDYSIRAMEDMIEVIYKTKDSREITIRKSSNDLGGDISGVYTNYPINKEIKLNNGVPIKIRGDKNKIYVMNMSAESGYYSVYCPLGVTKEEIEEIYETIRVAEEPKFDEPKSKYSSCELGDIVGDDVKRIKYHYYNIDYHKKDFSKKQILKLADKCLTDGVGNQYEMDCCMRLKMYPNY